MASVDLFPHPFGAGGSCILGISVLVAYPQGEGGFIFLKIYFFASTLQKKAWFTFVMEILWATKK
jgi:hypothetical protein